MVMNLFSIFDPYTLFLSNWSSLFMVTLLFISSVFLKKFSILSLTKSFIVSMSSEMSSVLVNKKESLILLIMSLMMFILLNNMMGLFPYIFTASSHLIYTLGAGLLFWAGGMGITFVKTLKHLLIHLTPMGTPTFLMLFMVCIESLSLLIRPITLSVRLMANMVAGHLLMVLLSNLLVSVEKMQAFFISVITLILLTLEFSVSIIQSYVFSILVILYMNESL